MSQETNQQSVLRINRGRMLNAVETHLNRAASNAETFLKRKLTEDEARIIEGAYRVGYQEGFADCAREAKNRAHVARLEGK